MWYPCYGADFVGKETIHVYLKIRERIILVGRSSMKILYLSLLSQTLSIIIIILIIDFSRFYLCLVNQPEKMTNQIHFSPPKC